MNFIDKLSNKKTLSFIIILTSVAVFLGQIAETRPKYFQAYLDAIGRYFDPIQYMVGLLLINFIFIIIVIKKYEIIPNSFMNTLKWYFTILFINDFLTLLFKVIQRSNLINLSSGFTGIGKAYLILAAARSLAELTILSIATIVLVKGLANYRSLSVNEYVITSNLKRFMFSLIVFKWFISIPLSFTGFLESRVLFSWSLVLSQISLIAIAGLIYWIVRELEQVYPTRSFKYFVRIFGINLGVAALTFTYSIGSLQLLQRSPAGEMGVLGSYGQFIYNASIFVQIILNYLTFQALYSYGEAYIVESSYNENENINDSEDSTENDTVSEAEIPIA